MDKEDLMDQYSDLGEFIKNNLVGEFSGFAYFDKHLDCIRIQLKDCSFTEYRRNKMFTILKENHTASDTSIGFNVKGISYLCKKLRLPKSGPVRVAKIIDEIVKVYPHAVVKEIQEKFGRLMHEQDLVVDLNVAEEAA